MNVQITILKTVKGVTSATTHVDVASQLVSTIFIQLLTSQMIYSDIILN